MLSHYRQAFITTKSAALCVSAVSCLNRHSARCTASNIPCGRPCHRNIDLLLLRVQVSYHGFPSPVFILQNCSLNIWTLRSIRKTPKLENGWQAADRAFSSLAQVSHASWRHCYGIIDASLSLYLSRDYSDLVIFSKDGSTRFPVHKSIICPRSTYIAKAVKEREWRVSCLTL